MMAVDRLRQEQPERFAFMGAHAVHDYARRILEAAARKGGAAVNVARKPAANNVFKFKEGEVTIVGFMRSAKPSANIVVRYSIDGRTYSTELKPNDPRLQPEAFKAWLQKEATAQDQNRRKKHAQNILRGLKVQP